MDIHAVESVSTSKKTFDSAALRSFSIREPGSAITHGIAMIFALIGAIPLMRRAMADGPAAGIAALVFCASMILLYGASTAFHTFDINRRVNTILKKMDHMMISVFIAGSYTPFCFTRTDRSATACDRMGSCARGNHYQSLFCILPEMGFFYFIYRHGMDLYTCTWYDFPEHGAYRFCSSVHRRTDLHDRRRDLRIKAPCL